MTALVTGAAGAIGSAIVDRLALSMPVLAVDRSRPEGASAPMGVEWMEADLLDADARGTVLAAIARRGVDRVVVAHGMDGSGELRDLDDAFIQRVLDVNTASVAALLSDLAPSLRERVSSYTVVVSQAGLSAEAHNVAYCASKFALIGWGRSIRRSMEDQNVSIRLMCLGCVDTPLFRAAQSRFAEAEGIDLATQVQRRLAAIPTGALGTLTQTASMAQYLSDPGVERPFILAPTGGETLY